jgi:hypothetical protein
MLGNYRVAAQLVASRVVLSSTELVTFKLNFRLKHQLPLCKKHTVIRIDKSKKKKNSVAFSPQANLLSGLMVRVPSHRPKGSGSIHGATRFSEK